LERHIGISPKLSKEHDAEHLFCVIIYSTYMKNAKSKVIYGADTTAVVLGGFTKGKTYWFQIRVRKSIAGYKLPFYTTFGTKKSVTITK